MQSTAGSSDSSTILAIIVLFIILASFISVIVYVVKLIKRAKNAKAMNYTGANAVTRGQSGERIVNNTLYRFQFIQGGKNQPTYFQVTIPFTSGSPFKINRKTGFDRFCLRLGLCVEISVNDPQFRDSFYIASDAAEFSRALFDHPENRRIVREIFDQKFTEINYDGKEIYARWNSIPGNQRVDTEFIDRVAENLAGLCKDIPTIPGSITPEIVDMKSRRFFSFAIPIALIVVGIIGMIFGFTTYTPLDPGSLILDSLKYSGILFVIFIWAGIQLLKGRSSSHRELLVLFILALVGFFIGGIGIETSLNGMLDKNDVKVHHVSVLGKRASKSKNSYTYHVTVESWRKGNTEEEFQINKSNYEILHPGESRMNVSTKPGKFGFEWIVNYESAAVERSQPNSQSW